jgi:integrase
MNKHNANNERIKKKYLTFLKEARGRSVNTVDAAANAIACFEEYNNFKDFKAFHYKQAIGFKKHLANRKHHRTGKPLSLATMNGTLRQLKDFIVWLAGVTGYKSCINYSDAEYFSLSENETRIAKTVRQKPVPSLEQIEHVLSIMPKDTAIEKRNRALIAFTLLTGARDSAIASMKLKHIDIKAGIVYQDAREVNTKFRKSITTGFFPVGEEVRQIVIDWVEYLQSKLLMGNDDPLFPKTRLNQGDDKNFQAAGLSREHWSTASPIRKIFKEAFTLAGFPNYNPHSFRNTLTIYGEKNCPTMEAFKAWSQNLGHAGMLTTLCSYGEVQTSRQIEIIQELGKPRDAVLTQANAEKLLKVLIEKTQE